MLFGVTFASWRVPQFIRFELKFDSAYALNGFKTDDNGISSQKYVDQVASIQFLQEISRFSCLERKTV